MPCAVASSCGAHEWPGGYSEGLVWLDDANALLMPMPSTSISLRACIAVYGTVQSPATAVHYERQSPGCGHVSACSHCPCMNRGGVLLAVQAMTVRGVYSVPAYASVAPRCRWLLCHGVASRRRYV